MTIETLNNDPIKLSTKQTKAIPWLLTSLTVDEQCSKAEISKQTYYAWLREPLFRAEITRLRNLFLDDALNALKSAAEKAVQVIITLLDDPNSTVRLKAANDLLGHAGRFKEILEIEHRLEEIEKKLENK